MAFSAQLTEQGQAQRLSGERESEKEQQTGRGNGCWLDLPPLSSPSNETSAVHATRASLCQPVCLNFKHNLYYFFPQTTNAPNNLRYGSCCVLILTHVINVPFPPLESPIRPKPGFLDVGMYLS